MFEGAASFYQDIRAGPSPTTRTRRGCSRAPTPGSPVDLERMAPTRRTGRRALGSFQASAWRTSASRSELVRCMRGWQVQRPGRRSRARCRHRVRRFGTRDCAEGRGGQLPRRRSHRRGVLHPRRGLRRRGDCRDAGLGRVAGDEHERAVLQQRILQRGYIAMGHLERHDHVPDVPRCRGVQPGYRCMGYLERHDHVPDVLPGLRVQPAPIEMGRQLGHDHAGMFYDANAFNKMPVGWDTSKVTDSYEYFILQTHGMPGSRAATTTPSPIAGGRARTTRATRPFRPSTAPSATAPTPS